MTGQYTATLKGGGVITKDGEIEDTNPEKEEIEGETSTSEDKKKKGNVREYDPLKDSACLMIGGYSSYIKKKKILAQGN